MRCAFALSLIVFLAFGQNAVRPSFEVASIRPGGSTFSTRPNIAGGTFQWTTQLAYLIGYAYDLDFSSVSSTQEKLGSTYSVAATFNPSASGSDLRLMVQSLLAERFKMQAHPSTKEAEGYALSVGKNGLKVKEASGNEESQIFAILPKSGVVEVTARNATVAQLAASLQRSIQKPVWDRTGLTGRYDFQFRYAQEMDGKDSAGEPWLGTAMQESLGLTMETRKGPVDTLVVDHIEQPSEN